MTNAASHTTGSCNGGRQQNRWCVSICRRMYMHISVWVGLTLTRYTYKYVYRINLSNN